MRKFLLLIALPFMLLGGNTSAPHLKYVTQAGDGVYSIMRKYRLEEANCNLQYFFKINDLRNDKSLLKNHVYELPIFLYAYNGTSIRSTIGNDNMQLAKAIQEYNENMVQLGVKSGDYRDNHDLWVPYSFTVCEFNEFEEPTLADGQFPIFGEKYSNIDPIDNKLQDYVFYIVAGHGGPDPGAVATIDGQTVSEDEYAYDISLRLTRLLLEHGATAYVIIRDPDDGIRDDAILPCDEDEVCWENQTIPLNQIQRLRQRAKAINKLYAKHKAQGKKQLCLPIHIDSRSEDTRVDMFFYHHPNSQSGKTYAETLRNTIKEKYDYYNPWRGYNGDVKQRDLYMLRETHPTTVYVELGNIQNPKDQDRFTIVSNRQAIAEWFTDGLIKMAE